MAYETPERLKKQLDFILQADAEKEIERRTLISSGKRFENDSEHAWHMALMAILLSEYANEEIDVLKTVTMILIHDIVEIDAGDTYCYDYELGKSQREREVKAANRIYALLPDDQGKKLRALWDEFEANETPEAHFAHAMDCLQPTMLNDATNGEMWKKNGIKLGQVLKRNEYTEKGSKTLWDYQLNELILKNVEKGNLKNE
ncbi:MAG TPA: HD domain-containing protein [Candidatus Eubacterium faecale]|uniref:HD domain-containing protein n=1 Tax=Candidatus Eubacterium faecale TaxID=2838568 RepID=A0A9D2S920_9FIRM|nr:HD domain-containing protein [Candidatus Eubacterium faecale]